MNIIEKLETYFKNELFYLQVGLKNEVDKELRLRNCWYCMQRCLGATDFAMLCGGDESAIEAMYHKTREQIIELIEAQIRGD